MKEQKNFSVIIEARMGSKRLPKKVMFKVGKKTMIQIMIKRLKLSKNIKEIIVATTRNKKDDVLAKHVKNISKVYRGSENNVLQRVIKAAERFKVHNIVKICGDSPLIDFKIMDYMISKFKLQNVDYLSNNLKNTFPDGMDIEIVKTSALIKSYEFSKSKKNKEHVTYYIKKSPHFIKRNIKASKKNFNPKLKLTLDVFDDFLRIEKIIKSFKYKNYFSCSDIIKKNEKN